MTKTAETAAPATLPARKRVAATASPPAPRAGGRKPKEYGPRHEDRRDTILRTAAHLFAERGFEATSLDMIADEMGMHKATLYHYIHSKQEVLYLCLVKSFADLDEVIADVQDPSRPVAERLRHFALALSAAQNNEYGRCLALVGPRPLEGQANDNIRQFRRKLDSTVRSLVQEGVKKGEFKPADPGLVAAMLFGTLNWVPHWYRVEGRLPLEAIVNRFVDMLVHGLEADTAVAAAKPAKTKATKAAKAGGAG